MEQSDITQPANVFLEWVKTLIPKDKYAVFVSLFKFPTPNIQLTNTIYQELERVFDGKNPSFNYQFEESVCRDDWEYYRQEVLKEPDVWRTKGWAAVKTAINSILIVDLPEEQKSERPEPYFYFLGIENVIDYECEDGKLKWIAFKQDCERVAFIDEESYRTFKLDGANISDIVERPHTLGYCPAKFFWESPLTRSMPDIKKSPLSPQLANLDWLLFFSTSKKHLDLYAPYPIYSTYEADCDFENNETGDYCDGGYLRNQNKQYKVLGNGVIEPCPICANKRLAGVGSMIEIPVPNSKDDADLRNPVQITTIDRTSLDYNVEEV
ncbi:MAG: hypothetical protein ACRCZZ_00430, partial [Phocaeicola sp.]